MKYTIQGKEFVLKPTSPRTRKSLQELYKEQADAQHALEVALAGDEDTPIPEAPDEYDWYFRIFCTLTEGPHSELDFEDFDIKVAERALSDFLPAATRTLMQQTGYLPRQGAS
jgi:hypothetical protein